ncbi:hypothetical protein GCM10007884_51620 [Methylobacterium brachythecii]|uniref:Uncharacterized protein n=2 Tax=Pseudomonadota TaxID=1224 RepID=A0ABQ6DAA6_9HYPH|nr:hypothetical protein GCM10007884_51620 [Methylobacterium brachythecii]GLT24821.1 hypothetical protein GCM10007933_43330 [Zoogloea oryzae]
MTFKTNLQEKDQSAEIHRATGKMYGAERSNVVRWRRSLDTSLFTDQGTHLVNIWNYSSIIPLKYSIASQFIINFNITLEYIVNE